MPCLTSLDSLPICNVAVESDYYPNPNEDFDSFIKHTIGADCWAIVGYGQNDIPISLINTYALYEAIGQCFNIHSPEYIPNEQYQREEQMRDEYLNNTNKFREILDQYSYVEIYFCRQNCSKMIIWVDNGLIKFQEFKE